MKSKAKLKTAVSLILNIILYVFLSICVISVTVTLVSKKNDDAVELFGYQMRIVTSESMAECEGVDVSGYDIGSIPLGSMVLIKTVPDDAEGAAEWYEGIREGDVLTFKYLYTSHVTITHRVVRREVNPEGGYTFYLEGDNKAANSQELTQRIDTAETDSVNYVIGKVVAKSHILGLIVSLLQRPLGIILVVIVPCLIIILLEIIKIVGVVNEDKRKKAEEETQRRNDELEALRRRIAELEEQNGASASEEQNGEDVMTELTEQTETATEQSETATELTETEQNEADGATECKYCEEETAQPLSGEGEQ